MQFRPPLHSRQRLATISAVGLRRECNIELLVMWRDYGVAVGIAKNGGCPLRVPGDLLLLPPPPPPPPLLLLLLAYAAAAAAAAAGSHFPPLLLVLHASCRFVVEHPFPGIDWVNPEPTATEVMCCRVSIKGEHLWSVCCKCRFQLLLYQDQGSAY